MPRPNDLKLGLTNNKAKKETQKNVNLSTIVYVKIRLIG